MRVTKYDPIFTAQDSAFEETQWAYLAGFIDADGCIHLTRVPTITVTQCQANSGVMRFLILFGGKLYRLRKGHWRWVVHGREEVRVILQGIEPHLRIKKSKARTALKWLEGRQDRERTFHVGS